jgi:hypothetical protein
MDGSPKFLQDYTSKSVEFIRRHSIHGSGIEELLQVCARQAKIPTPAEINALIPCDRLLSTPACSAYCALNSALSCRCPAAWIAPW